MMHRAFTLVLVPFSLLSGLRAQFAPAEILTDNWCGTPFITRGADVDGDGDIDLVTASHADGLLRWLENGGGEGDFVAPHPIGADMPGVTDLRMADMDGDGDADRVSCSNTTNDVQWSANDGAGGFGAAMVLATGLLNASSLELADMDQDGDVDIIATSTDLDSVVWIPNGGGGIFQPVQGLCGQADGAHDVAVSDLDGDGDTDLALVGINEDQPMWVENQGATFTLHMMSMSGPGGLAFCDIGDLNGDTYPDVAFGGYINSSFHWASNDGTGTFSYAGIIGNEGFTRSLNLADMDADGDIDALCTTPLFLNGSEVHYRPNDGTGSFTPVPLTLVSNTQSFIRADLADVNADGLPDVLLAYEAEERATWIPNAGGGTFGRQWMASPPCAGPIGLVHADLDGDGDHDLVVASATDGKVNWLQNDGSGGFGLPRHITHGLIGMQEACVGDIDGDGDVDVLSASQYDTTLAWHANDGLGHFGPQLLIDHTSGYNYCAALGDLDSDNDPDLVTTENNGNRLLVYLNNGGGTFAAPVTIPSSTTTIKDIAIGDLDGDTDADIALVCSGNDRVAWFANSGSGSFGAQQNVSTAVDGASRVRLGDLDGNGSLDIICTADNSTGLRWFPNDGSGIFGALQVAAAENIRSFDVADIDGDGDRDLVGSDATQPAVRWFANNGDGSFTAAQLVSDAGYIPGSVMAVDVDNDGDPDVAGGVQTANQVRLYESHATSHFRIQGRVFFDANSSGVHDVGEEGFPFVGVSSAPYETTPFTDNDGQYTFYLSEDQYSISTLMPQAIWALTTPSSNYDITLTAGAPVSIGNDFGYVPIGVVNDLVVSISPLQPGCNGVRNEWITWRNVGNTSPSGLIACSVDPLYTFVSAQPAPDSIVGATLYWSYASLGYYEQRLIHLRLANPDESNLGAVLVNSLAVSITEGGNTIATFEDLMASVVMCAYDPNDKVVDPVGFGEQGVVDVDVPFLEYTVRFQNTGTAPAASVVIRDQLDPALDRSSVQLVGSSHTPTDMRIEVDGELVFTFEGINLPDSVSDEPGSHGFVTFRASPLEGTPSGTTITNTADIYFDLNAPVITNTVSNLLIDCDLYSATIEQLSGDLLQASVGESYQWYLDGNVIVGATSQQLVVDVTGYYAVEVTNEFGCVLLSEEMLVVIERVDGNAPMHVAVIPNPMSDQARVVFSTAMTSEVRIELVDVNGRVVYRLNGNGTREVVVVRGHLNSGVYVLRVTRYGVQLGTVRVTLH